MTPFLVCIGIIGGNGNPQKPVWKTIRFNTKNLKSVTLKQEVAEIVAITIGISAKHYGWTDADMAKLHFDNPESAIPFLSEYLR